MRSRSRNLLIAIVVALAIGVTPYLVGRSVLHVHADRVARAELLSLAEHELQQAESAVAEAVTALRDADRAGIADCAVGQSLRLGDMAARSRQIRRMGLVDEAGYVMCFDPPTAKRRGAVLFDSAGVNTRQVTLTVLDPERVEGAAPGTALVAWKTQKGPRLVAELMPSAVDLDIGADFLRGARHISVAVGDRVWNAAGHPASGEDVLSQVARSDHFPLTVKAEVSLTAAYELVRPLEATLAIGSLAGTMVLIGVAFMIYWKPTSEVDDELSVALRREEFVPYFQPVMNIDTGRIEGCEMLVRWIRPDGTTVSPGAFMSYCETSGHVFEMTRLLMRKSVAQLGGLYSAHPDLKLSINLFAGHFLDRRIVEDVVATFEGSAIAFDQLVFEVTERYPLRDIVQARKVIAELHALGCRVALDDTGTGHGGLAYIQQLGIDIVKIDKMFIDAMGSDLGASTIVDVLVELANSLGMGVVAEGVETQEQLERLREKGVTSAQGYVFAPALPAKLFIDLAEGMLSHRRGEAASVAA